MAETPGFVEIVPGHIVRVVDVRSFSLDGHVLVYELDGQPADEYGFDSAAGATGWYRRLAAALGAFVV